MNRVHGIKNYLWVDVNTYFICLYITLLLKFFLLFIENIKIVFRGFTKYDSKLDFDCKSILKLQSNAKITQKPCEITVRPL